MTDLENYKTDVAARFEKIFLLPFECMEVSEVDFGIAFTQRRTAKDLALDIGLGFGLRPHIPD